MTVGSGMSPSEIIKKLQKLNITLFKRLTSQTVGQWIDRSGEHACWSENTLKCIAAGNKPGGLTTRVGILVDCPETTKMILTYLQGLQQAYVPLTLSTIHGIMIGQLEYFEPQIFKTPSSDSSLFTCSESFVLKFLHCALGWSLHRATHAGRKIPANADEILWKAFLHMAHVIKEYDITTPVLIVNGDQTQVILSPGSGMTYAEIGSSQVSTVGADDKRAFTTFINISADGTLLPFQAIYQGSTTWSLQSQNANQMEDAKCLNFLFEISKTDTYWSTQETMKDYINAILAPYFVDVRRRFKLWPNQAAIWWVDC
ncbi:hypothetical protein BDQ17DRAFT_1434762 [Cyathus striatus]|nr:hypothetical protein BDQ17DRAFT_1434762 [Cyathus striatus]